MKRRLFVAALLAIVLAGTAQRVSAFCLWDDDWCLPPGGICLWFC